MKRVAFLTFLLVIGFGSAHAAEPTATISLSASPSNVNTSTTVVVTANLTSTTTAVSAVHLVIPIPTGYTYVSTSTAGSIFTNIITNGSVSGSTYTFDALREDTGYTGTNGLIATISFTSAVGGVFTPTLADSQIVAYSDSSNILLSVSGATVIGPTPSPTVTATTDKLTQTGSHPIVIASILILLGLALAGRSHYYKSIRTRK